MATLLLLSHGYSVAGIAVALDHALRGRPRVAPDEKVGGIPSNLTYSRRFDHTKVVLSARAFHPSDEE